MINYKIEHIQEVSSTNTYLKELTKQTQLDEGTVILADFQTSGKGRGSSRWVSDRSENLTFSVLLKPDIKAFCHFSLVEFVSLSIVDMLKLYGIHSKIKWPNDIYIEDRKIAGILIENVLVESTIHSSIVGIGLNINQEIFPDDIPNPVSMRLILKKPVTRDEVFTKLLEQFRNRYDQLKLGNFDLLHNEYCNYTYCLGQKIRYNKSGKLLKGKLLKISKNGELFIEDIKGELTGYLFDEIQIPPQE